MGRRHGRVALALLLGSGVGLTACASGRTSVSLPARSVSAPASAWHDVSRLAGLTNYSFTSTESDAAEGLIVTGRVHGATDFEVDVGAERSVVVDNTEYSVRGTTVASLPVPGDYFRSEGEWAAAVQFADIAAVAGEEVLQGAHCTVAGMPGTTYIEGRRRSSGVVTVDQQACIADGSRALLSLNDGTAGASAPSPSRLGVPGYTFSVTSVGRVPFIPVP